MPSPVPETPGPRRRARWLWPAAALALAPKCLLCAAAYAGLGAALGLGGPELCGGQAGSAVAWPVWLAGLTLAVGAAGFRRLSRSRG